MSTKNHPGAFDCYDNLERDEPYFLVMARDKDAPLLVRMWALLREQAVGMGAKPGTDLMQVEAAKQCAYEMDRWRRRREEAERQRG